MPIDGDEVLRIARLARLDLDESKLEAFCAQLESILDYVAVLEELDVDDEAAGVTGRAPRLRADEPRPSLDVADALANAPDSGEGHFKVPRILTR